MSAAQLRRTGFATAVASTIGLAMVNTTGIAHSETTQETETRPTGTVLGGAGFMPVSAADGSGGTGVLAPEIDPEATAAAARLSRYLHTNDQIVASRASTIVAQRQAELAAERERIEAARWVRPIEARITQRFGGANNHIGVDFGAAHGTPIYAAHRGTVIWAGWQPGYGNFIMIEHENNVVTAYGHLSRIDVRVGQQVATGEQIGKEGNTGRSTGPHLHFEVRLNGANGTKVDPLAWLAGHGVTY